MRSELRLSDLEKKKTPSKLMNVKVPADVSNAIDRLSRQLGSSKTATVIALLNEGLDVLRQTTPQAATAGKRKPTTKRRGRPPQR
jgi:hypothetical protein